VHSSGFTFILLLVRRRTPWSASRRSWVKTSKNRRKFIEENALDVRNLDV
jgi:hypothetical protein